LDASALVDGEIQELPPNLIRPALRELPLIDAAGRLDDLRVPPGNRLEALKVDRVGGFSIGSTINSESAF
jgi:toxin HigB-1